LKLFQRIHKVTQHEIKISVFTYLC